MPRATYAGFISLIKAIFVGFAIAESWLFSRVVGDALIKFFANTGRDFSACVFRTILIVSFILIVYAVVRGLHSQIGRMIKSLRLDLLVAMISGYFLSANFSQFFSEKYDYAIALVSPDELLALLFLPILIGALIIAQIVVVFFKSRQSKKGSSFYINDAEIETIDDDLLEVGDIAVRFAERIFSGGAQDSIVFGLDAPWGVGKTSFINLCINHLEQEKKGQVIIYRFNPLRYEDRSNLLERFVDGLVANIKKHVFLPEIPPTISKYTRFVRGKIGFSLFGFKFDPSNDDIDDAIEDLESQLKSINKKIIVIVDDLDRLNFSAVKDVLFAIKKSFMLPNISYVLCYDTANIGALENMKDDGEKIREFFEKFVNVKTSLFLDSKILSKYINENLDRVFGKNLLVEPYAREKIKQAVNVIPEIYDSPDFHRYGDSLADIRKLKRLINTLLSCEIEKTDFENSDINKQDLIHLLLIYVNYPNVFRKIYNTETNGRRGFFSVLHSFYDGYLEGGSEKKEGRLRNSEAYADYVEKLPSGPRFLVNKIFEVPARFEGLKNGEENDEARHSYACFNGKFGGRNLETYLQLIVSFAKPEKHDQYKFYLNQKERIKDGATVADIFSQLDFDFSKGESCRQQFWRVIVNSLNEIRSGQGHDLIESLLKEMPNYSILENPTIGLGLRDDAAYYLISLLNGLGWSDAMGVNRNNTDENVAGIARWVLGESEYEAQGVVQSLVNKEKGALGLFDLLVFRLFCCSNRGGDFHNLTRSLAKHADPNALTYGPTNILAVDEMREISQLVFKIFDEQYIKPKLNILDLIEGLTEAEIFGKYLAYANKKITVGAVRQDQIDKNILQEKSRVATFVVYQLGNAFVESGVGCGYYDVEGKDDKHGIAEKISDYLFDVCFNPVEGGNKNYECFVDYLLRNYAGLFSFEHDQNYIRIPEMSEFTKVLNKERLSRYWNDNHVSIKGLHLDRKEKEICTKNYSVTYQANLPAVFKLLDGELLSKTD